MPFTLIRGKFCIVGKSPDGDSVRFEAANPANWDLLAGRRVKPGPVQLRIEAIDAPETHYTPKAIRQPAKHCDPATDRLLELLGFRAVCWDQGRKKVVSVAEDQLPGYILSRTTEVNGRPVSFVFAGDAPAKDGAQVRLDVKWLRTSVNHAMLAEGLAYPTYYQGLFSDLREALTQAAAAAKSAELGLWPDDKTMVGVKADGLAAITERSTILPKLFRRLVDYLATGQTGAAGFVDHLAERSEGVTVLPQCHFTHFDSVVEIRGGKVRLAVPPENLVFAEGTDKQPPRPATPHS